MKSYRAPLQPCGLIARYCSSLNPLLFLAGLLLLANTVVGQWAYNAEHEKLFRWVTGEALEYKHWGSNEPNNGHNQREFYGMMNFPSKSDWNDLEVGPIGGIYECEKVSRLSKLTWTQWPKSAGGNDHWYAFNPELGSWLGHQEIAKEAGGHLATMTSSEENHFVTNITGGMESWMGLWIPPTARKKPLTDPGEEYWRTNLRVRTQITGMLLGTPPSINHTSPTKSEPTQAQGNYTRQSLRIRTGLN